jgi:hypothetical protein
MHKLVTKNFVSFSVPQQNVFVSANTQYGAIVHHYETIYGTFVPFQVVDAHFEVCVPNIIFICK